MCGGGGGTQTHRKEGRVDAQERQPCTHLCTSGQSTRPFSMMGIRSLLMCWMMERRLALSTRANSSPRCAGGPARRGVKRVWVWSKSVRLEAGEGTRGWEAQPGCRLQGTCGPARVGVAGPGEGSDYWPLPAAPCPAHLLCCSGCRWQTAHTPFRRTQPPSGCAAWRQPLRQQTGAHTEGRRVEGGGQGQKRGG